VLAFLADVTRILSFLYQFNEERKNGSLERIADWGDLVTRMGPYHACQAIGIFLVAGLQCPLCPYPPVCNLPRVEVPIHSPPMNEGGGDREKRAGRRSVKVWDRSSMLRVEYGNDTGMVNFIDNSGQ